MTTTTMSSTATSSLSRHDKLQAIQVTLLRWALFSVLFATLPLLANVLGSATEGKSLSVQELAKGGEVLLIAAAVTAAAIGELFADKKMDCMLRLRLIVAGAGVLVIATCASWYAFIHAAARDGDRLDTSTIADGSLFLLVLGAGLGACAMIVAERSRWS